MLDFNILSLKNEERCEKHYRKLDEWGLEKIGLKVVGEVGELCNLLGKIQNIQDNVIINVPITEEELILKSGKELADIVIYCDLLATRLNLRLGFEVMKKFNEDSDKIKSRIKLHQL